MYCLSFIVKSYLNLTGSVNIPESILEFGQKRQTFIVCLLPDPYDFMCK